MIRLDKIIPTQDIQKEQKQKQQVDKPSFEEFLLRALAKGKEKTNGKVQT